MTTPLPELLAPYEKDKPEWWPEELHIYGVGDEPHFFFENRDGDSMDMTGMDAHVESRVFGAVYPYISDFYWIKPNEDGTWTLCAPDSFTAVIGSSGDEGPYYPSKLEAALAAWEEVKK